MTTIIILILSLIIYICVILKYTEKMQLEKEKKEEIAKKLYGIELRDEQENE